MAFISASINSLQDFQDYLKAVNVPFSFAIAGKHGYYAKVNWGDAPKKNFTQIGLGCAEGIVVGRGYELVRLSYSDASNKAIINS